MDGNDNFSARMSIVIGVGFFPSHGAILYPCILSSKINVSSAPKLIELFAASSSFPLLLSMREKML